MVRRKGEKEESVIDRLEKQSKSIDERHPVVETRWYVCEVTPSKRYSYDDGHGGVEYAWMDERVVRVSNYFDCDGLAYEYVDAHEPDPGNELRIYKQEKRRTTTEKWWSPNPIRNN